MALKPMLIVHVVTVDRVIDRIFRNFVFLLCFYLVQVTDVTSCFIVNRCYMCGGNPLRGDDPPRGVCVDKYNEVKCECLPNRIDPTRPYSGQFCYTSKPPAPLSNPADWTPVIIGSIAGVIGLIALISAFLWVMTVWGPLSPPAK